jgi:uncharacterized membrane protein/protein-disulfide isomerase
MYNDSAMTSRARTLILVFALVGLAFASASSYVHYRLLTDPSYISPCDVNKTFSCTEAYLSRFGSFRGVPVALGGVFWFALVTLVAGFAKPTPKESPGPAGSYVFALSTIGLAVVLYLAYASFFIIKSLCLLCMGTYVCVAGIFVTSGLTNSVTMSRLPVQLFADLRRAAARPLVLMTAVLFIVGAASVVAFFPKEGQPRQQAQDQTPVSSDYEAQFTDAWNKQPRVNLGIPASTAKVVVVKFNDFMCPSCKAYEMAYRPTFEKYETTNPGQVKLVLKDWPWNTDCNFNSPPTFPGHQNSCVAAAAVRMAHDRGKGEAMGNWLFDQQQKLIEMGNAGSGGPELIKSQLKQLVGSVDYDKEYPAKLAEIRRDVADGGALHVNATPTYYVNGVLITTKEGSIQPVMLDLAIKIELNKK